MTVRKFIAQTLPSLVFFIVAGCIPDARPGSFATSESQVAIREYQTRTFDTSDRSMMLHSVISTLQDLSFVLDKADAALGSISATKLDGYKLRMSVTVRQKNESQLFVRASAQFNSTPIRDPEPYQEFFAALQKSVFLAKHTESSPAVASEPSVGTSKGKVPATSASVEHTTAHSGRRFDGVWMLEIGVSTELGKKDHVYTNVANGRFSAEFETSGWRGRLQGEINDHGTLKARGLVKKMGSRTHAGSLKFKTRYHGDGFRKTVVSATRSHESFDVSLTQLSEVSEMAATSAGHGSTIVTVPAGGIQQISLLCSESRIPEKPWIGRWVARTDTARFTFDIEEEEVGGRVKSGSKEFPILGKIDESGEIDAKVFGRGTAFPVVVRGTFPHLRLMYPYAGPPLLQALNEQTLNLCS